MKKLAILLILGLISVGAFAGEGLQNAGSVYVNHDATYMDGRFNVRFDALPGHEWSYVYGTHTTGKEVKFAGRDAKSNRFFFCMIPTSSSLHEEAIGISNNLGDGTRLVVKRNPNNNECTEVTLVKDSKRQQ